MKVPCGGFNFNDEQFDINNDTVSLKDGGSSGSGCDSVYAHFTYDHDANEYVCDMTLSDLYGYFNNNIPVIGVMEGYELPMIQMDGFNNIAIFQASRVLSGTLSVHTVTYSRDGINETGDSYDLSTLVVNDG